MFEEEYAKAIRSSDHVSLFEGVDLETAAESVHDGYFAIDKKKDATGAGRFKESKEVKGGGGASGIADGSAYQLRGLAPTLKTTGEQG